jgi:hypothetical protein
MRKTNLSKGIILVLFLILCASFSFGLTSRDTELYSGESETFEGFNIYTLISSQGATIMVRVDGYTYFFSTGISEEEYTLYRSIGDEDVTFGTYPKITHDDLEISLKKICFNVSKSDCGRINDIDKKVDPSFHLRFEFKEPEVDVDREYSETDVVFGEEIEILHVIENDGDVDIRNFIYEETYPQNVQIKPNSAITQIDQTIRYENPIIKAGDSSTFKYKIKILDTLEYSLKGEYSYEYRDETYTEFTSDSTINLKDIITPELSFSESSVEPDEQVTLTLKLENNLDEKVDFTVDLTVPIDVKNKYAFDKVGDNLYRLSGTLEEEEVLEEDMLVEYNKEGTYTVNGVLNSEYLIQNPTEYFSEKVIIEFDEGELELDIIPKDENLLETEESYLELHFSKGDYITIHDLIVNISAGKLDGQEFFEPVLINIPLIDSDFKNEYVNFVLPEANSSDLDFFAEGSYNVEYSNGTWEETTFSESEKVKVYALEDAIEAKSSISETSLEQNETTIVYLTVKNKLDSRGFQKIYAYDLVPQAFVYKPIITEAYFNLGPLDEKQVYSYELKAPYFVNESSSKIISIVEFATFNLTTDFDLSTKVNIPEPSLSFDFELDSEANKGALTEVGFEVKNTGDLDIKDVLIEFPLTREMELFSDVLSETVDFLNPDEQVVLLRKYRAREEGDIFFSSFNITYKDQYGNIFKKEVNGDSIEVSAGSLDCYVYAQKRFDPSRYIEDNLVPLIIDFSNKCDEDVEIISEGFSFALKPGKSKSISFEETHPSNFTFVSPSVYTYSVRSGSYSTVTNNISEEVVIPVKDASEDYVKEKEESEDGQKQGGGGGSEDSDSEESDVDNSPATSVFDNPAVKKALTIAGAVVIVIVLMVVIITAFFRSGGKSKSSSKESNASGFIMDKVAPAKKRAAPLAVPKVGTSLGELKKFIKQEKGFDIPSSIIKQNLRNEGWDDTIIDNYLK